MTSPPSTPEHPIIFTGDSIPLIRTGTKTQSRRVVKDAPEWTTEVVSSLLCNRGDLFDFRGNLQNPMAIRCPYGAPGDRLWVRETFAERVDIDSSNPEQRGRAMHYMMFKADGDNPRDPNNYHRWGPWRSPRFMPRWASRMLLELTAVRVERLRAITEADAAAEGVERGACTHPDCSPGGCAMSRYRPAFALLWDSLNGKRRVRVRRPWPAVDQFTSEIDTSSAWASNPLVWVLTFRLLDLDPKPGADR